ncbi:MAG: hypothetical protein Q4D38_04620 [Planctomycetia bacterium]|nr:hypothetical protein [Planctomycetia bacterium]
MGNRRAKTILHLISSFDSSETKRVLGAILPRLDEYAPCVIAFRGRTPDAALSIGREVALESHFSGEKTFRAAAWLLRERIRPSVVHVWDSQLAATGVRLAKIFRAKSVAFVDECDPWIFDSARGALAADAALFAQDAVRKFHARCVSARASKWESLPHFVELPSNLSRTREEILEALELPKDALLIGCAGPPRAWKRWKWAIWSIDSIVRVHPTARLVFLCDSRGTQAEERVVRETQLFARQYERENIVRFSAAYEEILPHLDVFWNLQSTPGAARSMLEAGGAGVPIVTTDAALGDDFLPLETLHIIPTLGETLAAARATHGVLHRPQETQEKSAQLRQFIAKRYSLDAYLKRLREIYER